MANILFYCRLFMKYAYEAAVSKYGYEPVEGEHVLHGREDLKMFVKRFE